MITDEHAKMVATLCKHGRDIHESLTPGDCHLIHMILGISGEAGELLDIVKKLTIYRKEFTPETMSHIIEELGDLEFFMEGLRQALGVTRENTLVANMEKLAVRYKNYQYTDAQAQERADKAQETTDFHRE